MSMASYSDVAPPGRTSRILRSQRLDVAVEFGNHRGHDIEGDQHSLVLAWAETAGQEADGRVLEEVEAVAHAAARIQHQSQPQGQLRFGREFQDLLLAPVVENLEVVACHGGEMALAIGNRKGGCDAVDVEVEVRVLFRRGPAGSLRWDAGERPRTQNYRQDRRAASKNHISSQHHDVAQVLVGRNEGAGDALSFSPDSPVSPPPPAFWTVRQASESWGASSGRRSLSRTG